MKKIINIILSICLIWSVFTISDNDFIQEVEAYDFSYNMNCNNYEVDTVRDDGGFQSYGCYANFNDAKAKMNELGRDAVVRHPSSKSPTKIIAMVSGTAYSYPSRYGKNTLDITQYNGNVANQKTTYVTMHRELYYQGTESYDGNGEGVIHINVTGFDGYTTLKGVDLIPTKYTELEIPIMLGGNTTGNYNEAPFQTHIYKAEYVVEQSGNYRDLVFYWYSGWSGPSTYPTKNRHAIGLAPDWMETCKKYYSYDGVNFYSDAYYQNYVGTYYNYYQFLPLRTQSNIPASVYNNFLSSKGYNSSSKLWNQGQTFIDAQNTYGVNALLVYALACLESAYGTSNYAQQRNNLFGWSAYDSDPDSASYFSSVEQAIKEHMGINLRGYLDINDFRFFGPQLGNKGSGINLKYAADPYWGYKIAAIAYDIDKCANGYNGNLTDYNKYSLGVINTYGITIKQSPDNNSKTLYSSQYGATYQKNFMVTILNESSNFVKVNTVNPLSGSNIISGTDKGLVNYDFNTSVGYIQSNYVDKVSQGTNIQEGTTPTGDFVFKITNFAWNENNLNIKGEAYQPGIYVTQTNTLTHRLLLENAYLEQSEYPLTTSNNKDYATFETNLDISQLTDGSYKFVIDYSYGEFTEFNGYNYLTGLTLPEEKTIGNKKVSFTTQDDLVFMNIETVETPIDPSEEPDVTPEPSEDPETPPEEVVKTVAIAPTTFDYVEGNNLRIAGTALIKGMDAKEGSNIKHEIIFIDAESGEEVKTYTATTSKNPLNLGDGFVYEMTQFDVTIDIQELYDLGYENYIILMRITNEDTVMDDNILNTEFLNLPESKQIDGNNVYFITNQSFRFRYELLINNIQIDWNTVNKPSDINSLYSSLSLNIDGDENLTTEAASWMYNTDYNDESTIYQFILADINSGETYELNEASAQACAINYSEIMKLSYDYSHACFKAVNNLTSIPDGTYIVYMEITNGDYHDIFEVTDFYDEMTLDVTAANTGRNFKLGRSDVRDRLLLTISSNKSTLETNENAPVEETVESVDNQSDNSDIKE